MASLGLFSSSPKPKPDIARSVKTDAANHEALTTPSVANRCILPTTDRSKTSPGATFALVLAA